MECKNSCFCNFIIEELLNLINTGMCSFVDENENLLFLNEKTKNKHTVG